MREPPAPPGRFIGRVIFVLKVYAARWCPHCVRTTDWLEGRGIPFDYVDMDEVPPEVEKRVVEANGGGDWVVPTLEFAGRWRPGKFFRPAELEADLKSMGVI